jgi:hypothetical protein
VRLWKLAARATCWPSPARPNSPPQQASSDQTAWSSGSPNGPGKGCPQGQGQGQSQGPPLLRLGCHRSHHPGSSQLLIRRTFTAERIAYRNLLTGLEPPRTARHRNPFREWIGALIRADVHGWTNPGNPAAAAEQAHRDATLTHTANGVYAAMFTAATIATAATGTADVHARHPAAEGLIPLTCNEIQRRFVALVRRVHDAAHRLGWSDWRRRYQARSRASHYHRQAANQT